jgi:hypothetical protein
MHDLCNSDRRIGRGRKRSGYWRARRCDRRIRGRCVYRKQAGRDSGGVAAKLCFDCPVDSPTPSQMIPLLTALTGPAAILVKRVTNEVRTGNPFTCGSPFHERPIPVKSVSHLSMISLHFFRSAQPPLSPPFHPHSLVSDFRSVPELGVLVSAGAATCDAPSVL